MPATVSRGCPHDKRVAYEPLQRLENRPLRIGGGGVGVDEGFPIY